MIVEAIASTEVLMAELKIRDGGSFRQILDTDPLMLYDICNGYTDEIVLAGMSWDVNAATIMPVKPTWQTRLKPTNSGGFYLSKGWYLVSASVYFTSPIASSDILHVFLHFSDMNYAPSSKSKATGTYDTVTVPATLVYIEKSSSLWLKASNQNTANTKAIGQINVVKLPTPA